MAIWSDHDIDLLTRLYCYTAMNASEIGKILNRSPGAVRMKISTTGLGNKRFA